MKWIDMPPVWLLGAVLLAVVATEFTDIMGERVYRRCAPCIGLGLGRAYRRCAPCIRLIVIPIPAPKCHKP